MERKTSARVKTTTLRNYTTRNLTKKNKSQALEALVKEQPYGFSLGKI